MEIDHTAARCWAHRNDLVDTTKTRCDHASDNHIGHLFEFVVDAEQAKHLGPLSLAELPSA